MGLFAIGSIWGFFLILNTSYVLLCFNKTQYPFSNARMVCGLHAVQNIQNTTWQISHWTLQRESKRARASESKRECERAKESKRESKWDRDREGKEDRKRLSKYRLYLFVNLAKKLCMLQFFPLLKHLWNDSPITHWRQAFYLLVNLTVLYHSICSHTHAHTHT